MIRDMNAPAGSRVSTPRSAVIRARAISFCRSVVTRNASAFTWTVCRKSATPLTSASRIISGGATQITSAARPSARALKIWRVSSG